jgi:hypothetical protein
MASLVGRFAFLLVAVLVGSAGALVPPFPVSAPDDPRFAPNGCPPAASCAGVSGQWNLLSYAPDVPPAPHASGISADLAWQTTTGRADVVIAVLDSGVQYDHEDLRTKVWLNRGELPIPMGPCCMAPVGDAHDCNADGVFDVDDYVCDARVTDSNGTGVVDRGDLRVFADGHDDDANGYVDDLSGWDSDDDDGDEYDHRYFGHGTGRAGIVGPETNNGKGVAGVCPDCPIMSVRVDDTFVCSTDGLEKGVVYAVDNGARILSQSLGALNASSALRAAYRYATSRNVLAVNASANEFSFHQNMPAVFDDVMTVGAVTADDRSNVGSWLQKANFANYGAHLDVVAPTDVPAAEMGRSGEEPFNANYGSSSSGTSSSTPHAAGVAALVFARAHDLIDAAQLDASALALKDLSALEVREIIDVTADDVTASDLTDYPVSPGWDKWTGYGRVNAKAAVDRVGQTTIPPEADIKEPGWYSLVTGTVQVRFYANARWASSFTMALEVGSGVEPTVWTPLATGMSASNKSLSSADLPLTFSAPWDTSGLAQGLYTLRLSVADDLGNHGQDRMAVWVRPPDPADLPGFPQHLDASIESLSVALVDLDDDGADEIVFADSDGLVHALEASGAERAGFPVTTGAIPNLPLASPAFTEDVVPVTYASTVSGVAVGDLDRDGVQEIVAGAADGKLYCWHADASPCDGFPAATDPGLVRDQYPPHALTPNAFRGEFLASAPALGDLDGDGTLEIVAGSLDQKLYVWRADGSRFGPFPVALFDPDTSGPSTIAPRAIVSSAAIADLDGDGTNEIVVGTNETFGPTIGGTTRAYAVRANGTLLPGWPIKPTSLQTSAVPLVAEGLGTGPVVADVDGDGTREVIVAPFFGTPTVYRADGSMLKALSGGPFGSTGSGSDEDETTPEGGLARPTDAPGSFYTGQGAVGDLDGDGTLEYVAPMLGFGIASFIGGSGIRVTFDHLLIAWDVASAAQKPAYPRVMEDWQFFTGPAIADVGGDGKPEAIATSGGFYVHAFGADGAEPAGWPKLTGHWGTSTPSVGDVDGDGKLDVVQTTRLGEVLAWSTPADVCQPAGWRKFRHDAWNSGTFDRDTIAPGRAGRLRFHLRGRLGTLEWTAPGGDRGCGTAARYELRRSIQPIDLPSFATATPVDTGAPVAAGTHDGTTVPSPDGFLFYALRAVDEAGNAGALSTLGALDLRSVRIRLKKARASIDGLFPAARAAVGLGAGDLRIVLRQGTQVLADETIPASALARHGKKLRYRNPAGPVTNVDVAGGRRTRLRVRVHAATLATAAPGDLTVDVGVGTASFAQDVTLAPKRGALVGS